MINFKTIKAKLIISKNDKTIKEISIKLTIGDSLIPDIRKEIRLAAKLKNEDEFNIVDLSDGSFVNPSHFLVLDPSNSDHSFRIDILDHSKCLLDFLFKIIKVINVIKILKLL